MDGGDFRPGPLPAAEPAPAPAAPAEASVRRRVGARTFLIPLAGLATHLVTQTAVVVAFLFAFAFHLAQQVPGSPLAALAGVLATRTAEIRQAVADLSTRLAFVYSAVQILLFSLLLRALARRDRASFPTERPRAGALLAAAGVAVGLAGFTALLFAGLQALGDVVPAVKEQIDYYINLSKAFTGDGSVAWTVVSTCLLVPVAEELLFRGIVQNELGRVMPVWAAVLVQGVVFAAYHMNAIQSAYVLVPGILLGAVYAMTRSLAVPMALHVAFNLTGALVPLLLGDSRLGQLAVVVEAAFIPVAVLCLAWLAGSRRKAAAA